MLVRCEKGANFGELCATVPGVAWADITRTHHDGGRQIQKGHLEVVRGGICIHFLCSNAASRTLPSNNLM